MMDIDRFKEINDHYGHPVGDELLVKVARRLADAVPPDALVGRLGGDEFVVLAHDVDSTTAKGLAQHIVDVVRQPYQVDSHRLGITVSVGGVSMPVGDVSTYGQALRRADIALYAAKAAGKNQAVVR
jgi:diguanylate cyclase (GGDEF)-like protein